MTSWYCSVIAICAVLKALNPLRNAAYLKQNG